MIRLLDLSVAQRATLVAMQDPTDCIRLFTSGKVVGMASSPLAFGLQERFPCIAAVPMALISICTVRWGYHGRVCACIGY